MLLRRSAVPAVVKSLLFNFGEASVCEGFPAFQSSSSISCGKGVFGSIWEEVRWGLSLDLCKGVVVFGGLN